MLIMFCNVAGGIGSGATSLKALGKIQENLNNYRFSLKLMKEQGALTYRPCTGGVATWATQERIIIFVFEATNI